MVNYGLTRALDDAEHTLFAAACRTYVDVLVPYVATCLLRVYPGSTGALDTMRLTGTLREALRTWEAQRVTNTSTTSTAGVCGGVGWVGGGVGWIAC